jgi:hypothetical protein
MFNVKPIAEKSLTLVAASFDDRVQAEQVASTLKRDPAVDGQVSLIAPDDPLAARKMEPDQRGIWRTMLRGHVVFGVLGALAGAAIAFAVIAAWPAAASSPGFTLLFLTVLGTFFGGMVGGLVTLRPDHDAVIQQVHAAQERGQWAVVVRPLSEACARSASTTLEAAGATPMRSL